jgi:acetolactate synthase small subunit
MQHRMKDSHRIQLDKKLENLNFGVKPNADKIEQIKKQKEVEIQHRKEVRSEQNRLIEQKMALLKQKRKRDKKK